MLSINNLFYFFKTVECGSYAAAAKELYLTPQAVSNGVSSLEQELGLELVNKNRPEATPTPTGLTIFEHSLDIFESISNLEATAKLTREANPSIIKGHLRVAISSFLAEGGSLKSILARLSEAVSFYPVLAASTDSASFTISIAVKNLHDVIATDSISVTCSKSDLQ